MARRQVPARAAAGELVVRLYQLAKRGTYEADLVHPCRAVIVAACRHNGGTPRPRLPRHGSVARDRNQVESCREGGQQRPRLPRRRVVFQQLPRGRCDQRRACPLEGLPPPAQADHQHGSRFGRRAEALAPIAGVAGIDPHSRPSERQGCRHPEGLAAPATAYAVAGGDQPHGLKGTPGGPATDNRRVARPVKLSPEQVERRRAAWKLGGRPVPLRPGGNRPWTARELTLLGSAPDTEIATRIGRTVTGAQWERTGADLLSLREQSPVARRCRRAELRPDVAELFNTLSRLAWPSTRTTCPGCGAVTGSRSATTRRPSCSGVPPGRPGRCPDDRRPLPETFPECSRVR